MRKDQRGGPDHRGALLDMVLKETSGNQTHAANIFGINRNTLRKKINEYNIKCPKKT